MRHKQETNRKPTHASKLRRAILFRSGKPNVRPLKVFDEQGNWSRDMGVLWAAYKSGSFNMEDGLSQNEFLQRFSEIFSGFHAGWLVEDRNAKFRDGNGPVLMVLAAYNGWELEPHMEVFDWASPRNVLRSIVAFLQMMRYMRDIGVVIVHALDRDKRFFAKVADYGVLFYAGRIPHGDIRGTRNIFHVRGRKEPKWAAW